MLARARWHLIPEGGQAGEGWLSLHDLDLPEVVQRACVATLSTDEIQRLERRRFPEDRRRFGAARGQLRAVLAALLGVEPAALCFQYGADGKPALAPPFAHHGLQFNISHSGAALLVAVVAGAPVGVDLERHRPLHDRDGLVRRHFSAAENAAYFVMPEPQRHEAFFAAWARKEALVKAMGRGLRFPLRDFDVSLQPHDVGGQLQRLRHGGLDRHFADTGWWLGGAGLLPGFASAVALPCRDCRLVAL